MPVPDDPDALFELIEADVRSAFGGAFPDGELDIPSPFADLLPIGSGDVTAVPWRWTGTHTGTFHEVRPTGLPVQITGTTFLVDAPGGHQFVRMVDWHTLYRQLGLLMVCRRPQTPGTVDADDADRPEIFA